MYLEFGTIKPQARVFKESTVISKHTNLPLRLLRVEFIIKGTRNNGDLLALLDQAKIEGVFSVDQDDNKLAKWKIGNNSWRNTDGSSIYYHTLDLEEMEELDLTSLILGKLTLRPYSYLEKITGFLEIEAKVLLSKEQDTLVRTMKQNPGYFSVIRHGINEQPIEMRMGLCYWSEHDEGIKHSLKLISKEADDKPSPVVNAFYWFRRVREQAAMNKIKIDTLVQTLLDKNVLSEAEAEQIQANTLEHHWGAIHDFFKVEDIDGFSD